MKYLSLNAFLKAKFGTRVQKIVVDAGFSCPNRDGTIGHGGCIYCNSRGSGNGAWSRGLSIEEQISAGISWARRRYGAKLFLVYLQAYSNTYGELDRLQEVYSRCLCHPDIVGVCIGTRPDCVDEQRLDLIADIFEDKMVWMEYGLQSANDRTLELIARGHSSADFQQAMDLTRGYPFLTCAHVIFGLPGEDHEDMLQTIDFVKAQGVDGIKFHQLYVASGTRLARLWKEGGYRPMERKEYAQLVATAIKTLPPSIVIHRLTGDPAPDELLAPQWAKDKQGIINLIHSLL